MPAESNGSPYGGGDAPKLRTACENCRQSKVKCNLSGKNVCTRCLRHGLQCQYGFANRSGKPKGSKNRATLRKLGQLQDDKPPIRGFRGSRVVPPMPEREPLVATSYSAHLSDPMIDDDVCLIPGPPGIWESSRSFGSATALDPPICPSQLGTIDGSPFTDLMDLCPSLPPGLGYPHTPVTPTFLSPDPLVDGMASPPFVGSVSSSYSNARCECMDKQLFYMNRMNHLLAESVPLRFDQSLQTIKATFCACRMFLQCVKCPKESGNLLLATSVLNLTLQLFEHWITRETSRAPRAEHGIDIRYGHYEACSEENQRIRSFLLRGLLLQCRDVLSMLTATVSSVCLEVLKTEGENSRDPCLAEEPLPRAWAASEHLARIPDPELEPLGGDPGGNCLLPIIAGYEATVEAFLHSIPLNDCICRSKYSS
ncbi:hypothetical protein N7468_004415 [Penicillium chermesinum]|uniref:Zn(2)-C6 fungal-type domain-containing protein n=1 Tax=Penicillium chermesinum TaxID=63820 RepID=A0A9W9TSK0_9EURO|nr:uncharacterized protein N7468_004415 [Penicillium chermesinum]KAJ5239796.1 hypothetical protein N7468_004415 [Penicillium chermesinum]